MSHLFQTSIYITLIETLTMFASNFTLQYCTKQPFPTILLEEKKMLPNTVMHSSNPTTQKAEAR